MSELIGANRNMFAIAGRAFVDLHKLKLILGPVGQSGVSASRWTTLRLPFTTGGYLPGTAFNFLGGEMHIRETTGHPVLLYNDNDVGQHATSAPAGATYLAAGDTTMGLIYAPAVTTHGAIPFNLAGVQSPAAKYISCFNNGSPVAWVKIWGYES